MPNGKAHATGTLVTAGVAATWLTLSSYTSHQAVLVTAGCLAGLFLTPDLDLAENRLTPGKFTAIFRQRSIIGVIKRLVELVWWLYWWPYGKLVAHRSFVSHFPVVGTAIRVAYVLWIPVFIWIWLQMPYADFVWFASPHLFLGLAVADTIHAAMDVIL